MGISRCKYYLYTCDLLSFNALPIWFTFLFDYYTCFTFISIKKRLLSLPGSISVAILFDVNVVNNVHIDAIRIDELLIYSFGVSLKPVMNEMDQ